MYVPIKIYDDTLIGCRIQHKSLSDNYGFLRGKITMVSPDMGTILVELNDNSLRRFGIGEVKIVSA